MALSVLAEISRMLETLAGSGEPGFIDLKSLPLSDADRAQLEELLGRGEVRVEMDLAGASEIWETAYSGVWWTRHRGALLRSLVDPPPRRCGKNRNRGNLGLPDTRNTAFPPCRY